MKRNNQPFKARSAAIIDWQSETPVSSHFGDVYYSREDGAAESQHTFLAGNL